jgi:hypothetical protein
MRVLILNQAFHPDVVSSAQHASDLARKLAARGFEVTVLASSHGYDDPRVRFPVRERWCGVEIRRVRHTNLGKGSKWRRAADFASFYIACTWRLMWIGSFDAVIAMTSPPLISFLSAVFAKLRRGKLFLWMMDLNPDEAIAAGWIQPKSFLTRVLERSLRYSFESSELIVVLDRFMRDRVLAHSGGSKVAIVPPWTHDSAVHYDAEGRLGFRREHGLEGKFVVMYSGNHSPCHPLTTLLEAALALAEHTDIAFCFIGGGSEFAGIKSFVFEHGLENVLCLPYQPLANLSSSLSAADLHVVAMGNSFVGIVHPCKVYNILKLGIPFLYIGPPESHVTDMVPREGAGWARLSQHGETGRVVSQILEAKETGPKRYEQEVGLSNSYSEDELTQIMFGFVKDSMNTSSQGLR